MMGAQAHKEKQVQEGVEWEGRVVWEVCVYQEEWLLVGGVNMQWGGVCVAGKRIGEEVGVCGGVCVEGAGGSLGVEGVVRGGSGNKKEGVRMGEGREGGGEWGGKGLICRFLALQASCACVLLLLSREGLQRADR